jgi:hypothetical protein
MDGKQIPYVVAGMGGFYNLPGLKAGKKPPVPTTPASGTDASGNPLTIEIYNDTTFGFLRVTVTPATLTGEFITVDPATGKTGTGDTFTVDLGAGTVGKGASVKKTAAAKKNATKGAVAKVKSKDKSVAKKAAKALAKTAKLKAKLARKRKR